MTTASNLLIAGQTGNGIAVWRMAITGDLDPTFGVAGYARIVQAADSLPHEFVLSIFETLDGTIYGLGTAGGAKNRRRRPKLFALTQDGQIDQRFAVSGALDSVIQSIDGPLAAVFFDRHRVVAIGTNFRGVVAERYWY